MALFMLLQERLTAVLMFLTISYAGMCLFACYFTVTIGNIIHHELNVFLKRYLQDTVYWYMFKSYGSIEYMHRVFL